MNARTKELLRRSEDDPFNDVALYRCEGGMVILLSHRISMDKAVAVFVQDGKALFYDHKPDGDALDTLNHHGAWPSELPEYVQDANDVDLDKLATVNDAIQDFVSERGNEIPAELIKLLSDLDFTAPSWR